MTVQTHISDVLFQCWEALDSVLDEYNWIKERTGGSSGWTRNSITITLPNDMNAFFPNYYRLSGLSGAGQIWLPDRTEHWWDNRTVYHEYGHAVMFTLWGIVPLGSLAPPIPFVAPGDLYHYVYSVRNTGFAISEGWAEFMQTVVQNSSNEPNMLYAEYPPGSGTFQNIENNRWWIGDTNDFYNTILNRYPNNDGSIVEGSAASILWHIYNDNIPIPAGAGYGLGQGFNNTDPNNPNRISIWHVMATMNSHSDKSIQDFWSTLFSEYSTLDNATRSAVWNVFHNNHVEMDNTPPALPSGWSYGTGNGPVPGTWSNNQNASVDWSQYPASDDYSGVAGYSVWWNHNESLDPGTNDTVGFVTTAAASTTLGPGTWWLHIAPKDHAGNQNYAANYRVGPFKIDNASPEYVTVSTNGGSSVNLNQGLTINWTATDSGSGISTAGIALRYSLDGGSNYNPIAGAQGLNGASGSGSFTWTSPLAAALSPNAKIQVVATDIAGNTAQSESATFEIVDPGAVVTAVLLPYVGADGYATTQMKIQVTSANGVSLTVADGISAYNAHISYDTSKVDLSQAQVVGANSFNAPSFTLNGDGADLIMSQSSPPPLKPDAGPDAPNVPNLSVVAELRPILVGSVASTFTMSLSYSSITRGLSGYLLPPPPSPPLQAPSRTFRRANARTDGAITISDALFISQYLANLRQLGDDTGASSYTTVNAVNAASPHHNVSDGDKITTADALYISQYLAGLRDGDFNPLSATAAAIKAARSKALVTNGKTTVEIGSASLRPGATARIPITIKNIGDGLGLGSYDLRVTFDNRAIRVDRVEPGPFAPTSMDPEKPQPNLFASTTFNIDNANGRVFINGFQPKIPGPTGDVVVAFLLVRATGAPNTTTSLKLSGVSLYSSGFDQITALSDDRVITIK